MRQASSIEITKRIVSGILSIIAGLILAFIIYWLLTWLFWKMGLMPRAIGTDEEIKAAKRLSNITRLSIWLISCFLSGLSVSYWYRSKDLYPSIGAGMLLLLIAIRLNYLDDRFFIVLIYLLTIPITIFGGWIGNRPKT